MDAKEILGLAYLAAKKSPDPRTQVGAVLFAQSGAIVRGFNAPFGEFDTQRYLRSKKYRHAITVHAELSTVINAASVGERTDRGTLYAPWSACRHCASVIIAAGIGKLVRHEDLMVSVSTEFPHWVDTIAESDAALQAAGIEICEISGVIDADPIRIDGELFYPGG